ncbi:MAG: type II toxin-antitoxin system antitoxin SocA domain-containing protein [Vulcanibacillus sp.]
MDKNVLYELRKKNNYSQEDVRKHLKISRPLYRKIENDISILTIEQAKAIAGLYNVTVESIICNRIDEAEVRVTGEKSSEKSKNTLRIDIPQRRLQKFKQILLYILGKVGGKPNVGETVLYKLLYFIEFDYYEKYEEQLMGLTYIKNHYGPTPVEFKKVVQEMEDNGELEILKSKHFKYDQKKYIAVKEPDFKYLGDARELNHINEVLDRLSDKNASELSYYSHMDVPWITAEDGQQIKYEAVFYRTKDTSVRKYEDKV